MKRTILLFCLMVCFAMGLSAQSIVGKWRSEQKDDESNAKMVAEMTFNTDNTLLMNMHVIMDDPNEASLLFHVSLDGTYSKVEGNALPFKLNRDKAAIIIDKLEFHGEIAEQLKTNKELEQGLKKMIQDQVNESKNEMVKDIPAEGEFTVSELTDTTMKLQIKGDDEELTFTKIQ